MRLIILLTQQPDQRHLQHLTQLAQYVRQFGRLQQRQRFFTQRRQFRQLRAEQAGFREQAFAAGAAQIIDQRQDHQRQIATGALHTFKVNRQLPQGL